MKKVFKITLIILFILCPNLLAQWEVNIDSDIMYFMNIDEHNESAFAVAVDTSIADDFLSVHNNDPIATVVVLNSKIEKNTNFYFRIKRKSGNYINYSINNDEDIIEDDEDNIYILIGAESDSGIRGDNLIKILLNSINMELYNKDTNELLGTHDLEGLQEILEENLGDTEWYENNIKN